MFEMFKVRNSNSSGSDPVFHASERDLLSGEMNLPQLGFLILLLVTHIDENLPFIRCIL